MTIFKQICSHSFVDLNFPFNFCTHNLNCNLVDSKSICNLYQIDSILSNLHPSLRIPTYNEFLNFAKNCHISCITQNKIAGCLFTSKINRNSIFLPATEVEFKNGIWHCKFNYLVLDKFDKFAFFQFQYNSSRKKFKPCKFEGLRIFNIQPIIDCKSIG